MILSKMTFKPTTLKTTLVDVPQFGQGAQMMLTQLSVKGYVRRTNLYQAIGKRNLSEEHAQRLSVVAGLMSAIIDPETGDFLIADDQLDDFEASISGETLESLILGNAEVNPFKDVETLNAKKK